VRHYPSLACRIGACGDLPPESVAAHLAACDLLVQPYPDGISSRRSSAMAGLALGLPTLTTTGPATESVWQDQRLVALTPADELAQFTAQAGLLLSDARLRDELGARARMGYERNFSLQRTIDTLRA
jgi:glycosyltransferase involved in cell wall biosynthesis